MYFYVFLFLLKCEKNSKEAVPAASNTLLLPRLNVNLTALHLWKYTYIFLGIHFT